MREQWWNEYIGIPYKAKGRCKDGLDCWGLARLVYKEQLAIELPSFDDKYEDGNVDQIKEAIAAKKEAWDIANVPRSGDIVLFRVNGAESHVGIVTNPGFFLHVREGQDSVIERIDSISWKNRYVGTYRYREKGSPITLSGMPHPLKTVKVQTEFAEGSTIQNIVDTIVMQTSAGIEQNQIISVNGKYVPKEDWPTYQLVAGSQIEYRSVATGSSTFRMVAMLAVIAVAMVATAGLASALALPAGTVGFATMFGSALSMGSTFLVAAAGAGIMMAGTFLVNSIFPTRYSTASGLGDFATQRPWYSLQGGNNPVQPYSAIPVVLGRYRFTPPAGALPYGEVASNNTYLRTLLVWGYGPLQVNDIRIGDTPISNFEEVEYETLNGWDDTTEDKSHFNSLYGKDVEQISVNTELKVEDGYIYRTFTEDSDYIRVDFHFPEGLYAIDPNYGNTYARSVYGRIQIKSTSSSTWNEAAEWIPSRKYNVQPAWYNIDNDVELEPVYRWTRFSLSNKNQLIARTGSFTQSQYSNPSGTLLTRLRNENFGFDSTYDRMPSYGESEEALYDVCVYGNSIVQIIDNRDSSITGVGLSSSGLELTFAEGSTTREENASWYIRRWTKDPFSKSLSFQVPRDTYDIRISKTGGYVGDNTTFNKCILTSVTSFRNARPVAPPKTLAMTALRIRASNQLNGSVQGVVGTCQSICYDYDSATNTWIKRPTRNPASLMRYVLQHPANAQRVADSKINLDDLAVWHTYCKTNKFNYDGVMTGQVALLDVIKDIAAAGRSSPTIVDGKWTVITDKPRTQVSQHFTPYNSWGFEGLRSIPRIPHAFRVQFSNAAKGYEADERIVYNDGYSASNATLYESLQLPGVTDSDAVYKHARFHLAQLKLRPETYTISADFENIICTRGDLVRVTHDVPMWGLGSGRIKERVNSTTLKLTEKMPMDAGVQYTIRIRLADNTSITRTVEAKVSDGYYDEVTLTSSVTTTQGAEGNLFMFGEIGNESVDLIVQSIEPQNDHSAQLTLVDYSPAVYDSDDEPIPAFDSQITKPAKLQQKTITQKPTISEVVSDERAMTRIAPGIYQYSIRVGFKNPSTLPDEVVGVQGQIQTTEDDSDAWQDLVVVDVDTKSITFTGVEEGVSYKYRLRYVDKNGITGGWTTVEQETVEGRINPPPSVSNVTVTASSSRLLINWDAALAADVESYEVRTTNSGWGTSGYVFKGATTSCYFVPATGTGIYTFYVKAIDSAGNYSINASSGSYSYNAPATPTNLTYTFFDTALTTATITLKWDSTIPTFGLRDYQVNYGSEVAYVNANTITLPANWIGNRNFSIRTRDQGGNISAPASIEVTKLVPLQPTGFRASVIDNNVMLYWVEPSTTTLPISHYRIKKGSSWESAIDIGTKDGEFTTINESVGGTYRYWIATVDTDGYESTPISVTAKVSEPPDFIFHGSFDSNFSGTKSSALLEQGYVVIPVNLTETWQEHFDDNSWSTPQDQIDAGYPVYIQPTPATGSYSETFDFGTILSSSKVTVSYSGTVVANDVDDFCTIETSDDNVTWSVNEGTTEIFATNFRYVRVTITVNSDTYAVYKLETLNVRCDAKQKTDAGTVSAVSTDASGTIVNFNKEFIDIDAITLTPAGTTVKTAVYDFKDAILSGTYSVTSNVVTVNITGHDLIAGQNVRLNISTGTATTTVVTILTATTNSFTAALTTGNTSGNLSIYPESFRVYMFDSSGTRISGTVSWNVRGY